MKFLSLCRDLSKQWLLVYARHLCLTERKVHPTCFSRRRKIIPLSQALIIFAQLLREPGPLGQGPLPQPPGTSSKVPAFMLPGFSSLPLHMGRTSTMQTFVVERTTGMPSISLPNSQGDLVLLSQLGTLQQSVCQFLICTVDITVLPHPVGILQTEVYEYSAWD